MSTIVSSNAPSSAWGPQMDSRKTSLTVFLPVTISGSPLMGLKIGGLELITKFVLYYFHERIWLQFKFGTKNN